MPAEPSATTRIVTPTVVAAPPATDALNALTSAQFRAYQLRAAGASNNRFGRFTSAGYPLGPSWAQSLGPKPDFNVVFTSVINIVTTPLGSVPWDPFLGSEIPNLVFEVNDAVTRALIQYFVERELGRQEPRVNVLFVRTFVPDNEPHTIVVTISFKIVGDPEGRTFSAPIEFNTLSLAA